MEWSRTLRVDAALNEQERRDLAASMCREGVVMRFGPANSAARTYALVEGPSGIDPAEVTASPVGGRWYDDAIIALAIEPTPSDALPFLAEALGGEGSPAGVCSCDAAGGRLLLEFRPDVTPASLVLGIADVELRRFGGHRRTELLSPLSTALAAAVAADGLQAPEIAPGRILEELLERAHVE